MPAKQAQFFLAIGALATLVTATHAQTRIEKTFDNWLATCEETDKTRTCTISQSVRDAKDQVVFVWIVTRGNDGKDQAVLRTPLGVRLPSGVKITIADAQGATAPFLFCGPRACTAEFPFDDTWGAAFRKQTDLSATYATMAGQTVSLKVMLKGFAAAYDYYTRSLAAPAPG